MQANAPCTVQKTRKLTETNSWYLARYTGMSETLKKAHELKKSYCEWFNRAKQSKDLVEIKERLEAFYREVEESKIPAFIKAIRTFKNLANRDIKKL